MKSLLLILGLVALCSGGALAWIAFEMEMKKYGEQVVKVNYAHIITNSDAETVMEYHGILSMEWSIPHKDFIFKRDGKICRARAFEILKERK